MSETTCGTAVPGFRCAHPGYGLTEAQVELVRSTGGVFEIFVNGQLKFSKKALGRFPTDAEVDALANG